MTILILANSANIESPNLYYIHYIILISYIVYDAIRLQREGSIVLHSAIIVIFSLGVVAIMLYYEHIKDYTQGDQTPEMISVARKYFLYLGACFFGILIYGNNKAKQVLMIYP